MTIAQTLSLLASLGLTISVGYGCERGSFFANGREYTALVGAGCVILHACATTPGGNDGHEVARCYGPTVEKVAALIARA